MKNKDVVQKRKNLKMNYTEDVLDYELIYNDREKQRVEKEADLMKKI